MPVVRRPQNFSVMPSVSSGGTVSNPMSMDAATLPGRQISALGEAIQSSGAQMSDMFAKAAKEKAETTVALDGSNKLTQMRFDLADPNKVFPGVNDWSKTDHALSEFDKGWADISANMSPGAQAMLDQSALTIRGDLSKDLARQDGDRARTFRANALNTRVNLATGALMTGASDNDAAYASQARAALVASGLGQGLSGEDLDKQTALAFGRRVVEPVVTARLSQGDVTGARAFFDSHREGMASDDADLIDKHLVEAGQAADTRNAVDGLWDRLGPKNLNDPIDVNAVESDLVDRYGGDSKALQRARDEVLHRLLGHVEARDDYNAGNANAAIQLVRGGASPAQLAISPQFLALPQDQQQQIADWHREQVTDKLAGFAPDQNLDRIARQFAAYHDLTGDDALRRMSEARISALEPVLGGDLTKQALAKKQAPPALDNTEFAALVKNIGLDPDLSDVFGKAQLGVVRSAADKALAQTGTALTPQRRLEITFEAAQNAVSGHPLFEAASDDASDPTGWAGVLGRKTYGPAVQVAAGYGSLAASDIDLFHRKAPVASGTDQNQADASNSEKTATVDQQVLQILADRLKDPFIHYDPALGTLVQTNFNIDGQTTNTPLSPDAIKAFKERALNSITYVYDTPSPQELALKEQIAPGSTAAALKALMAPKRQTLQEKNLAEARANLQDPRVRAYLATIAYAENGGQGALLEYNSSFGDHPENPKDRKTFSDFSKFPPSSGVEYKGTAQTANGRYQITGYSYPGHSKALGLTDFSPDTQDLIAAHMMAESRVIDALRSGDFTAAVDRSRDWASFPKLHNGKWGTRYDTQKVVPYEKLQQFYDNWLKAHPDG